MGFKEFLQETRKKTAAGMTSDRTKDLVRNSGGGAGSLVRKAASSIAKNPSLVRKYAQTSGKRIGSMKLEGQKKLVKVYRRYTQGFN